MASTATLPRSGLRNLAAPLAVAGAVAASWVAVGLWRPDDSGPVLCPLRALTGLDCPFCGATRAAAALAHCDLGAALDHNAFLILAVLPIAVVAWVAWARGSWRGSPIGVPSGTAAILMAMTAGWWALRLAVPWLGSGAA